MMVPLWEGGRGLVLLPLLVLLLLINIPPAKTQAGCSMHNNCNGHGLCQNTYSQCQCYEGWGADSDISDYKAPDCSQRE